jgi:uncharacterized hydrophobic protein (TIGR00341 family)
VRVIEIVADAGHLSTLTGIAEQYQVTDFWNGVEGDDGRIPLRMLVDDDIRQKVIDAIQNVLATSETARIIILPVEATLPRLDDGNDAERKKAGNGAQTREELYNQIERGARLDSNFLLMVFLSTVVASIGLIENNIAVVVGAMVIAPLLGPNIALAFAASLGDGALMWQSLKTNLAGLGLAMLMAFGIGLVWPGYINSQELLLRTDVGLDGVLLALASGAAAVLSLTTGLSSALVGVMVAVAILPPAVTMGMMLGSGQSDYALGAGLLLAVNVVCINLSAKLMFLLKGVRPRTWLEKRKARQSLTVYIFIWFVTLGILLTAILLRDHLIG